jgi:hypothetical protein
MFFRKAAFPSTRRATAIAVAAALALTAVVPSVASAASDGKGLTATTGSMTDISARRRGFNPGAAAVAGVVGLGIAAAAAANSRAYYDDGYGYYGGGPVYVAPAPGPYYYGGYGGYGRYGSGVPADQNGHPLASW